MFHEAEIGGFLKKPLTDCVKEDKRKSGARTKMPYDRREWKKGHATPTPDNKGMRARTKWVRNITR